MVVALLDQAVVDVALVGLPDANVGALAAHDGAKRVDDGHAGNDEWDDKRGERGGAAHVEQRDGASAKPRSSDPESPKKMLAGLKL